MLLDLELQTIDLQLYGISSLQYRDAGEKYEKHKNQAQAGRSNASRIARVLKQDHQHPETPKCE